MRTLSKSDRNKYHRFSEKIGPPTTCLQCIYMAYLSCHSHSVLYSAFYSEIPVQYARIILDFANRTSTITRSFFAHQKFMRIFTSKRICVVLSTRMHYMKIKPHSFSCARIHWPWHGISHYVSLAVSTHNSI